MTAEEYFDIACKAFEKGDFESAIENYTKAIEIKPEDADAYNNRGIAKKNLKDYHGAIEDYDKATEINPEFAETYYNRGIAKYNLKDYHGAIEDYDKAIEINPEDAMAYYNRGLAYEMLNEKDKAGTDWLTCLYLSIKQNDIELISKLLTKILNNSSEDLFLDAYPQNIKYIFEKLQLTDSFFSHFQSAYNELSDFDLLFKYYENSEKLKDRELLNIKALLYYYLGGNVQSFCIYTEKLDDGTLLSARELYYYASTAQEIGYYSEFFLDYCISLIGNKTDKTSEDYYYLGQLYMLDNDIVAAKEEFNNSLEHKENSEYKKFSAIMLKEEIDEEDFKSFVLSGEIDYKKDLAQFDDYFHITECQKALPELDIPVQFEPLIWKAFYLTEEAKYHIDEQLRKFVSQKLKTVILDKWEFQIKNALQETKNKVTDTLLKYIKSRYYENNNDDKVEKLFEQIKKDAKCIGEDGKIFENYEEVISLAIENITLKAKDYLSFIYYFFLKEDISPEETFYLRLYLKYKMEETFYQDNQDFIIQGVTILSNVDKPVNLIKIAYSSYRNEQNNKLPSFDEFTNENKQTEYKLFKETCWKLILVEYNALGEEAFYKQYEMNIK